MRQQSHACNERVQKTAEGSLEGDGGGGGGRAGANMSKILYYIFATVIDTGR